MQPTPFRLSQALWTAFRAAKPTHRQFQLQQTIFRSDQSLPPQWSTLRQSPFRIYSRSYSDGAKSTEIDKKAEEVKQKIDESLDARANITQDAGNTLKSSQDETIVHTIPEASSIVHSKETKSSRPQDSRLLPENDSKRKTEQKSTNSYKYAEWASSQWQNSPLPSQIASLRSRATQRFTTFMDNFQSQIVVAAHHINDLTGYTGIERLKKEIETQETAVQNARKHVKDSREKYSEAISMRATTQREVNDLLHRKHAWSPTDLERFTHLYRSDHANEQSEAKAHQTLSEAEAQYEEASTRLAKSILARYHEEQIWSDKIRQMSTWGTWGLMGLNVLLFIIFQIAIEPWRRRRLVRGFEEKVQAALDEKEKNTDEKFAIMSAQRNGDQLVQEAVQKQPEGLVATAAEEAAEAIVDAITGANGVQDEQQTAGVPASEDIENAAEQVAMKELEEEAQEAQSFNLEQSSQATPSESLTNASDSATPPSQEAEHPVMIMAPNPQPVLQSWQEQLAAAYHQAIRFATDTSAHYSTVLAQQFNEKEHVVLSRRDLTAKVLEGVVAGVGITIGFIFIVIVGKGA